MKASELRSNIDLISCLLLMPASISTAEACFGSSALEQNSEKSVVVSSSQVLSKILRFFSARSAVSSKYSK